MRLIASLPRRHRWRQSPPLPLIFASFNYSHPSSSSSSSSQSLFSTSISNYTTTSILLNYRKSNCSTPHNYIRFSRRFSTEIPLQGSDEFSFPVKAVISLLDSYHDASGLPWWVVISSSTVALRLALFPQKVLQLKKLKRIAELLPKLPPPFPPPLSGRSFRDQLTLFFKEKKTAGCPSLFWFISSLVIEVPCFFVWLMSIRRMSLNNHPGFDSGGTLWFENLTEYPHGTLGPIFPLIIAGLHFTIVQISLQRHSRENLQGLLGSLMKIYKIYLELLTLPILVATFNVPQGSLIYWLTNSSMSLTQIVSLQNPKFLDLLGIPKMNAAALAPTEQERQSSAAAAAGNIIRTKDGQISVETLSPEELVSYSVKILTDGRKDTAIRYLRIALEKDPGNVRALLIMGQTLIQNKQFAEAVDYLEKAISKLRDANYPTEVEKVDHLILSSLWAGIANVKQGKMEEGLQHLERIGQLEEPEDSKSKAHYYDGLLVLSSALLNVDRKAEALKYLQKAAAYNPEYNVYLEQLEAETQDFTSDLVNSRREF
ncbi:ALBINO3-like protein 2, chloroplastic [Andrographis paniculata]|uniref:ALBINO3-like protein 2, chloroplastic n=1 Tax=Andrographis paniculata TaxID=175694 RepID=UPI0021E90A43|nr:ALBINO3-like protein 2, chloroplastic [Andrographis paniculata]